MSSSKPDVRIWPVVGSREWEVVDLTLGEPNTLMISTLARCREEYPEGVVER